MTARHPVLLAFLLLGSAPARAEVPDRYRTAVDSLDRFIAREVESKEISAFSVALVDDQAVIWSKGYGFADRGRAVPATSETVYRVGSVSKLFADIATMRRVERGKLDLDAPVTRYLPDFAPKDPFGGPPITLRHLMTHRSGLVREPPVGSYFDATSPTLAATVASLNGTSLVYRTGERAKYSNAGVAVVGLAAEKAAGVPFEALVRDEVLGPLGMARSTFAASPDRASASMWSYHGKTVPAPGFAMGIGPAGGLDSTAVDLSRFVSAVFEGGKVIKPSTLEEMTRVQFAEPGQDRGFGLGFAIRRFEGRRRVGHGGAVYGFATEVAALPADKLGVVAIAAKDCGNAVTTRVADVALRLLLAAREGKPLPAIEETAPLPPGEARRRVGRYHSADGDAFDLTESEGRLYHWPAGGGNRVELRAAGADYLGDDALSFGPRLKPEGARLRLDDEAFDLVPDSGPPPASPARFAGLIGEYGRDDDILYILEKDGKLHALIEWFFLYPLNEDESGIFSFPASGLYEGEKLVFRRDPGGRADLVTAAGVPFARRPIDGEGGVTFRIKPLRPVAEIRREAAAARPPDEAGDFRPTDLVDLVAAVPGVRLDVRYATDNNFLGQPVYTSARALMQRPAAEALAKVQARLGPMGYGLLIHDAYRPWKVTQVFWDATPPAQRHFVANPRRGSRHNRGCAVDLSMIDRATGQAVEMVGGYDEFSDRSYPRYPGGTSRQRWHRERLREAMEAEGFAVNINEWWHFDSPAWREYRIGDVPFEDLPGGR